MCFVLFVIWVCACSVVLGFAFVLDCAFAFAIAFCFEMFCLCNVCYGVCVLSVFLSVDIVCLAYCFKFGSVWSIMLLLLFTMHCVCYYVVCCVSVLVCFSLRICSCVGLFALSSYMFGSCVVCFVCFSVCLFVGVCFCVMLCVRLCFIVVVCDCF